MIFSCKIVLEFIRFKTPNVIYRILNTKGIKFKKTFTFTKGVGSTFGLAKWLVTNPVFHRPVRYSTSVPASRISIEHFAITSTKEPCYQLRFAGLTVILLPPLRQAVAVMSKFKRRHCGNELTSSPTRNVETSDHTKKRSDTEKLNEKVNKI